MHNNDLVPAAIVYDFDGTLAQGNIQEHSFLPELEIEPATFWKAVKAEASHHDADEILVYMRHMLERAKERGVAVTRSSLGAHGQSVPLFEGVSTWFERINLYAQELGLGLQHYVISSGIREMIQGCPISDKFRGVFASSFIFDHQGQAVWPAVAINYTTKTQYLFRINKGIENCWDNEKINSWIPMDKRAVPFPHMIFIGDGETDVPSMKMVRHQGGYSIAVFDQEKWIRLQRLIHGLISADRVNFVAPADYSTGSQLDVTVRGLLGRMAEGLRQDSHRQSGT